MIFLQNNNYYFLTATVIRFQIAVRIFIFLLIQTCPISHLHSKPRSSYFLRALFFASSVKYDHFIYFCVPSKQYLLDISILLFSVILHCFLSISTISSYVISSGSSTSRKLTRKLMVLSYLSIFGSSIAR